MFRRLGDWVDQRTGHRAFLAALVSGEVRGGSRWSHTLGAVALALLLLEAVTGLGLSAFYAPSTTDAWPSVNYIQNHVTLGWMMRGLHHYGAHALVIVVGLHLFKSLVFGAYRAPRELNWIIGVLLFQLVLLVSHLGFLLPGDLHAYWATQVLVGIAGNQPLIGEQAQLIIQGGPEYGNLTLTRFYALHTLAVPGALALLVLVHLALRRRHGATALSGARSSEPYFPNQLVKDLAASALAVLAVLAIVVVRHGAELQAPADPSVEYIARPEWYFLPVFQLRHYFTGRFEFVATTVLPALATFMLCALPFIHARLERFTRHAHRILVGGSVTGLLATVGLGGLSAAQDWMNPDVEKVAAAVRELSERSQRLASLGVPITGPTELYKNDPLWWGERVFAQKCQSCHHDCRQKPYKGDVCLAGYASRTWLTKLMKNPADPYFFGNTGIDEMDPWSGDEEGLEAVVEFLYAQGDRPDVDQALAEKGRKLYVDEGCESCHTLDGKGNGVAPDLLGYASAEWLSAFIRRPDAERFYGEDLNQMDAFPHEKLSNDELKAVVTYLRAQTDAQAEFP